MTKYFYQYWSKSEACWRFEWTDSLSTIQQLQTDSDVERLSYFKA